MKIKERVRFFRFSFFLLPALLLVFLLCPVCVVKEQVTLQAIDYGYIKEEGAEQTDTVRLSGLDLVAGVFVTSNYQGEDETLLKLSELKNRKFGVLEGKEQIETAGALALAVFVVALAIIVLDSLALSKVGKRMGGSLLKTIEISTLALGAALFALSVAFVCVSGKLCNFWLDARYSSIKIYTSLLASGYFVAVLSGLYFALKVACKLFKWFDYRWVVCE